MKQVPLTDALRQKLTTAAGDGVDANNLAVFEAEALNTNPVRKRHPIYKGAVHSRGFMNQMATALNGESLPLQMAHNTTPLPVGRVFYAEVVDDQLTAAPQLRTLFWVDKSNGSLVTKLDNGTVDQVSVSILPKSAMCNCCGFDFFSPDATLDSLMSGTCPDGHTMGENGAHVLMSDLDNWGEMSLVGRGGIPGARIASRSDMRLAANGADVSFLTLNLSSADLEKPNMDLTTLVANLTDEKAKSLQLAATIAAKDTQIAELTAKLPDAAKVAELTASYAAVTADLATVKAALIGVGTHLLAIKGDVTTKLSDDITKVAEFVTETTKTMKLAFGAPKLTAADGEAPVEKPKASSAFTAPK